MNPRADAGEGHRSGLRFYDALGERVGDVEPFPSSLDGVVTVDDYLDGTVTPSFRKGVHVVEAFGYTSRVGSDMFPVGSYRERRFQRPK